MLDVTSQIGCHLPVLHCVQYANVRFRADGPSGPITKAGDVHARTLLIEAAHSYRYPARVGCHKLAAVDAVPDKVRDIAWKAQTRLCQRYRHMVARTQVVVTAIGRELAGVRLVHSCITSVPVESDR
nr:hypothetical protein [uncultured Rhodopila sp.]